MSTFSLLLLPGCTSLFSTGASAHSPGSGFQGWLEAHRVSPVTRTGSVEGTNSGYPRRPHCAQTVLSVGVQTTSLSSSGIFFYSCVFLKDLIKGDFCFVFPPPHQLCKTEEKLANQFALSSLPTERSVYTFNGVGQVALALSRSK